ncbi:MAG: polysaccharide biosynthesis protein [Bryobacterales bacterium]|nr:polysaccharide biosynthesis protein [Bryobacterales bacterium]
MLLNLRRILILAYLAVLTAASLVLAFLLRFDFSLPGLADDLLRQSLAIALGVKISVFFCAKLDRGWWRFVSIADLVRVFVANSAASALFTAITFAVLGPAFPRSVYIIDFLICFPLSAATRFAVRLYNEAVVREVSREGSKGVLIYGAGVAGAALARDIRANPGMGYHLLGFLDDDPKKWKTTVMGAAVLGSGRSAPRIVERLRRRVPGVSEIIIAMPSASGLQMREALANCRAAGVVCKTLPGLEELLSGKVRANQVRNVSLQDLLGREPVRLEEKRIREAITGRAVLVTGGAGSIGSELCRQVADFAPRILVVFDQAESDLYRIELELRGKFPGLHIAAEIGDVADAARVDATLAEHRIDCIFHAAAYKHVPMMESQVVEAVKNNVIGTWNVVQAARRHGVSNFLLISTDKAVNPVSIMGVTKRVCELMVAAMPAGQSHGARFTAVRFGNVLGSNGSVVPLFQSQIAAGGPVTVTHPEVRRYFMSIREAVQLVLQASTMGKGSEIFLLEMGEPVRIADMARNMIRLSGLVPDEDIEIRYVGLRPGEKLFEELITSGENILPTYHEKIKIFQGPSVSLRMMEGWVKEAEALAARRDPDGLVEHLKRLVPEYQASSSLDGRRSRYAQAIGD